MSDKEYGPHELWCDTQNNISTRCNCMASGYIEDIEKLKKQNEILREALEYNNSKHNEWIDRGHWCDSKRVLQSIVDSSKDALKKVEVME